MPTPFEISDRFTTEWARLHPDMATEEGIAGFEGKNTDYSPTGAEARADLYRATLAELEASEKRDSVQEFAASVLGKWLESRISDFEEQNHVRDLNHIASPFQAVQDVFDVMADATVDDWMVRVSRLNGVSASLDGYAQTLKLGLAAGDVVAQRQVRSVIHQAYEAAGDNSRYLPHIAQAAEAGADPDVVTDAVDNARRGFGEFADWLTHHYLPAARLDDAVGRERYLQGAEHFLGMEIDPDETYDWGWNELHEILDEVTTTCREIDPTKGPFEVIEMLDTDPARAAHTRQDFVDFVTSIQHQAVDQLAGEHFEVPDEIREVTVNIAPPGGSLGAWYHVPSEDFSRPGSIWYAPGERTALPLWSEVTTAYHEGFPGHHLQLGTAVMQREHLSRFHRSVIWYSGSGEGWALYAERLMDELGYFENPEYRLGLLMSQLFRSIRVVLDIGCQLGKTVPDNAPILGGEKWSYEVGVRYMTEIGIQPLDMSESEVTRYLGWVGQAISYKLGEREILEMRKRARLSEGESFDLAGFHKKMLEAGAIRLDHLWDVMG